MLVQLKKINLNADTSGRQFTEIKMKENVALLFVGTLQGTSFM